MALNLITLCIIKRSMMTLSITYREEYISECCNKPHCAGSRYAGSRYAGGRYAGSRNAGSLYARSRSAERLYVEFMQSGLKLSAVMLNVVTLGA